MLGTVDSGASAQTSLSLSAYPSFNIGGYGREMLAFSSNLRVAPSKAGRRSDLNVSRTVESLAL